MTNSTCPRCHQLSHIWYIKYEKEKKKEKEKRKKSKESGEIFKIRKICCKFFAGDFKQFIYSVTLMDDHYKHEGGSFTSQKKIIIYYAHTLYIFEYFSIDLLYLHTFICGRLLG